MALITDPQAVKFENETLRQYAEHLLGTYLMAKAINTAWFAQGLNLKIPNDTSTFNDGSQTDGRPIVTGAAATNLVTRCQELIADLEANSNAKLSGIYQLAVTPR